MLQHLPFWMTIRLRTERQYLIGRAIRRRRALIPVANRTKAIGRNDILAFVALRNERVRLPYFLDYHRKLGVKHFLCVDNASTDDSAEYLTRQPDVSLWKTHASYKHARFGMDWIGWLLFRYGHDHWCLTLDPDEFFVYPHCDSRPLSALTDWMDETQCRAFPAMLLDMYPEGALDDQVYQEGQNPFDIVGWFDPANYTIRKNKTYHNLWIQGGPRSRVFFANNPASAPALNKIPLVRWHRRYAYVSSTHMLLPRSLNKVYAEDGGELASGCLLHAKFISTFSEKSAEELTRRQHYADSQEYKAYHAGLQDNESFWCKESRKYIDWQQLEDLGLISRGNWP